jgi:diguanylate cyclase (GGDEF)-like protein/PAS domain S-box-containing protein
MFPDDHAGTELSPDEPGDDRYRRLVESLNDYAVILLDTEGRIVSWNRGAERIKGYTFEEIRGRHFSVFYTDEANAVGHPDSELSNAKATGRYEEEGWRVRKDGSRLWAKVAITAMYGADGTFEGYGKLTRDLTDLKQSEQQVSNTLELLRKTAHTDPLTGLPNRRALDETLNDAVDRGLAFSVAMIDLDNFKQLNDELGHAAGDRLLREAAAAWQTTLRDDDVLARYGGDEFVVLLPTAETHAAMSALQRVRAATPIGCTCSAGLAVWKGGMTVDDLLGAADRALYEAKGSGRDAVWPVSHAPALKPVEAPAPNTRDRQPEHESETVDGAAA